MICIYRLNRPENIGFLESDLWYSSLVFNKPIQLVLLGELRWVSGRLTKLANKSSKRRNARRPVFQHVPKPAWSPLSNACCASQNSLSPGCPWKYQNLGAHEREERAPAWEELGRPWKCYFFLFAFWESRKCLFQHSRVSLTRRVFCCVHSNFVRRLPYQAARPQSFKRWMTLSDG